MGVTEEHVLELASEDLGVSRALEMIGEKTGLLRAFARAGRTTPAELAERSGFSERFVGEWLSGLIGTGVVADDGDGRFHCLKCTV